MISFTSTFKCQTNSELGVNWGISKLTSVALDALPRKLSTSITEHKVWAHAIRDIDCHYCLLTHTWLMNDVQVTPGRSAVCWRWVKEDKGFLASSTARPRSFFAHNIKIHCMRLWFEKRVLTTNPLSQINELMKQWDRASVMLGNSSMWWSWLWIGKACSRKCWYAK